MIHTSKKSNAYKDWKEFAETLTPEERREALPKTLDHLTLDEVKELYAEIKANYNTTTWD
jgi:response regulator of citrate/malate metabolism